MALTLQLERPVKDEARDPVAVVLRRFNDAFFAQSCPRYDILCEQVDHIHLAGLGPPELLPVLSRSIPSTIADGLTNVP